MRFALNRDEMKEKHGCSNERAVFFLISGREGIIWQVTWSSDIC